MSRLSSGPAVQDLLLLDCYLDEPGATRNFLPALRGLRVHSRRVLHEPVPEQLDEFDAVLISGSAASVTAPPPWLDDLEALVRRCAAQHKPLLGVCFGHQVIASALFGRSVVETREEIEIGWLDIEVCSDDPLFDGLGKGFRTFVSHYDQVREDQLGPVWTARSAGCPVQGLRIPDSPIWGVQFHCEMSVEEASRLIRERTDPVRDHGRLLAEAKDSGQILQRLLDNFCAAAGGAS
ncbi:MAG: type 1 glutamine amidotransferase [Myxococcota bacterium]|nr:type 1 glutamine amidotransferase [Myxococcota bacterium]